jgi:hypothetical protein
MGRLLAVAAAAALLVASHGAQADERQVLESLKFQNGTIALGDNLASLTLTPNFKYLSPADAKKFLVDVWGNPPGSAEGTLGAVMPAKVDLLSGEGWPSSSPTTTPVMSATTTRRESTTTTC